MKKVVIAGLLISVFASSSIVFGDIITLTDVTTFSAIGTNEASDLVDYGYGTVSKLDGFGDFITWEHQYIFNPPVQDILSADLTLSLRDDNDCFLEYALLLREGSWAAAGEVDNANYQFNANVNSVADGSYRVSLASLGGDFYIDRSKLTITYNSAASVPEPSVISLLGISIFGIGLLIRRKKS